MAAAELTASVVQKESNEVVDAITGTAVRYTEYTLKATKATQADWILLEGAIGKTITAGNIIKAEGVINDSSSDLSQESLTYDDSADKLVLAGAAVGTAWVTLRIVE